jgi:hypothetical protein
MVSLNKDSPIDNLLVEWVIVAELQDLGELDSCIPVMLGNVFETWQKDGKFTKISLEKVEAEGQSKVTPVKRLGLKLRGRARLEQSHSNSGTLTRFAH